MVHHRQPGTERVQWQITVRQRYRPGASPPPITRGVLRSVLSSMAGTASGASGPVASAARAMNDGRELALPFPSESSADLLIGSVLATLTSAKTKQAYATALADLLSWKAARGELLSKPLVGCMSEASNRRMRAMLFERCRLARNPN